MNANRRPRIGLALGSGSARGWAHIGVIHVLERAGISADIVCGTSVGALVGAAYAAGEIERFDAWARALRWQAVVGMLDLRMGGGLIEGTRLVQFFRSQFDDQGIEKLPKAFGCVATELGNGREIWLRDGPVIDAVRASIALPGLFTPSQRDGRLLVDGCASPTAALRASPPTRWCARACRSSRRWTITAPTRRSPRASAPRSSRFL